MWLLWWCMWVKLGLLYLLVLIDLFFEVSLAALLKTSFRRRWRIVDFFIMCLILCWWLCLLFLCMNYWWWLNMLCMIWISILLMFCLRIETREFRTRRVLSFDTTWIWMLILFVWVWWVCMWWVVWWWVW